MSGLFGLIADDLVADITALLGSSAQLLAKMAAPVRCSRRTSPFWCEERTRRSDPRSADCGRGAGRDAWCEARCSRPHGTGLADSVAGLEQTRQQSVRQAALTCFFGWTLPILPPPTRSR